MSQLFWTQYMHAYECMKCHDRHEKR